MFIIFINDGGRYQFMGDGGVADLAGRRLPLFLLGLGGLLGEQFGPLFNGPLVIIKGLSEELAMLLIGPKVEVDGHIYLPCNLDLDHDLDLDLDHDHDPNHDPDPDLDPALDLTR